MAYCKFCNSAIKVKDKRRKFCDDICRKAYHRQKQRVKHRLEKVFKSSVQS